MNNKADATKMKQEKKRELKPKLRFPEFREAGGWEEKSLDKIAENLDNRRIPITESNRIRGNIPYYGASGLIDYINDFIFDDDLLCISEDGANLVARTYPIAFSISGKSWVNNHAHVLRFKNISTQKIIESYLNSIKIDNFLTGMAQPKLNRAMLDSIPIHLPDIAEQQKIASCLSSLDELIAVQSQKLDTLKAHKKGLMQKLFPAEGETLPQLRFPEFREAGEWEEKAISELTPPNNKYGIVDGPFGSNLKSIHYKSEGVPIITSGYVTDGFFYADKYQYVSKTKFEEEKRSAVRAGDIVMAKIGVRCGSSAIMPDDHETGILSGNALKITIDNSRFSTNFVWQVLWRSHINGQLDVLIAAGAQPALSIANLKKYKLLLPTKEEQQKIADCLSSLDDLITTQTEKIESLKAHKKGLMQQLFPNTTTEAVP